MTVRTSFGVLLPACLLAVPIAPVGAGEIRGRVLVEGRPAAGATVLAVPFEDGFALARREARREAPPKPLATAVTRPDGGFALTLTVPPGALVRLSLTGGGGAPWQLAHLLDGTARDLGDVRLPKAAPLAGRVLDERGGPVVGATVTLWPGSGRRFQDVSPGGGPPQTATSGPDGTFRFDTASDEGNRIRVEAPAFATLERTAVRAGALTRPVLLPLGQVVRGTATLADRRTPAAGALVRFEGRTQTTRWVEARPDGTFVLEGVPRETGSVVADGGDRGRAVAASGPEPVAVALAPTATLGGRVVDASDGRPISGVRIVAEGEGGELVGRSGPDGRYSIRGVAARGYRLVADDERHVRWSRRVIVRAGQAEAVDVPLVRGATLSGRVTAEDGRPIEGATVQLSPGGENVMRRFERAMRNEGAVRTGRDGTFRATRLPPGENQRLDVTHDEYEPRAIGGVALAPGAARSGVAVVLRRGRALRGVVKDDAGRPLAGAEVTLLQPLTMRAGRGGMQMSIMGPGLNLRRETGADGRFEFRGLKPGDYALAARRPGFSRARLDPAKVGETGEDAPVELVLRPGSTITGFVRDKTGAGASGWYVSARAASEGGGPALGPGGMGTDEPTGPDGAFVLDGLNVGETYELQAMGSSGLGPRKPGVVAPADGVDLVVTGAGQVRGRVVDADSGRPIPEFQLRYQPDAQGGMRFVMRMGPGRGRGPYERVPVQADDGSFVLEDVPAGRWTVEAFSEGYQAGSASGVAVGEGEVVEGVEVRLSRGAVLSGRVLDARTGRPILDASVRAEQSGAQPRRGMIRMGGEPGENESATDGEGRYEIAGLAPGTWTVTASHAEWSETSESVEIKGAAATADIRLGRGGSIGGVVSAGGRPVPGAQVSVSAAGDTGFRASPGFIGGGEQSGITDESGRFRFERMTPGRYTLTAALRDQSSAPVEATLTGDEAQEVQLTLAEGTLVRGVVRGLPDAQLVGLGISAQGPSEFFATTRTGAGGAFELAGVPDGTVTLNARSGDFMGGGSRSASTTLQISPGQPEAAAEIVFEPGIRVDGRVIRGGKPIADAWVSAFAEGAGRRSASDQTDDNGAFVLEGLDEGKYHITASAQSGAPIQRTVELSGDLTVDLEAPPARLAGTVVEAESGRPLGDVEVRLEDAPGAVRFMTVATTDSSGHFAFEDVEPKRYRVSFQKAAYQVETRELAASEEASDLRVELRRGEGIGVEARDGILATPLRGLFVRVVDAGGQTAFAGGVSLDSDGRGEVPSLRPGTYEVRAESSGYAPVALPGVAVPSRTLTLVLTPGGSLEIRVGPETLARPEATARLLGADGRVYPWNVFTADGKIRLASPTRRLGNVAPGRYVLEVEGGERREVAITEGGSSVVALP